ncbi:hypothetical protein TIFTF001_044328 [Ficus carica]|uniref:Uncharacterized protein n=1 Tax=Ficus carica TaxID=3494 RepID=A0AA87ZAK0_FICCA|nr:hypothetical protein TIFTF001_044328 [Ficus carica]
MTLGERAMPSRSWADFHALMIARYGPLPDEDVNMPYRDHEIYRDMYLGRYLSYDLGSPELQVLHLLQEGLPPEIKRFVPAPMAGMTVGNMIDDIMEAEIIAHMMQADALVDDYQVPVDDASIREPLFEEGPLFHKDSIPAVPLQEIMPQEAEADIDADDFDPADVPNNLEENQEDPPIIIIASDDEEDVEEELVEEWEEFEGIEVDMENADDDPDKILFDDEDWDVFSDVTTK